MGEGEGTMTQTTKERINRLEKAVIQLQSSIIDLNALRLGAKDCGCSKNERWSLGGLREREIPWAKSLPEEN